MAKTVENANLDSVWVGDSLFAKPRLEPMTTLAAIASVTEKVRLGTAVLLMSLRHPVLLAQTMATVDLISNGRLVIAAGTGGAFNADQKQEWQVAGVNQSTRALRLEEMVQILKGLGTGDPFSFDGTHFALSELTMRPPTVKESGIPILLACHWRSEVGQAQVRRASQFADGIISISDTPEEYSALVKELKYRTGELGKNVHDFEHTMYLTVNIHENPTLAQRDAEEFLLGYYGANIWGDRWGPFGECDEVRDKILAYGEAGAKTVIVRFASLDPERQLNKFLTHVAPFI
jgi:alkanesulfonate monooxygenase SsuD/methylene tetrahydromethanopterin reductase-like flavin-dependent oxidoreductase (luciferase family)